MSKNKMVFARITEEQYNRLVLVAKALATAGEKVNVSVAVRDAIRKYLES